MTTRRSVRWWLGVVAACALVGCSQNKSGLHVPDAGAGGQTKADAVVAGGAGGGTGGAATGGITGRGGGGGGPLVDAPVSGGAGGTLIPDAAAGSGGRTGGTTGMGGASGGAGGTTRTGGTGGGSSCPMVPPCNWCGGSNVYDSNGCVVDWRCANGVSPCTTSACGTSNPCATGYTCGTDRLCWPEGTGGVGGGAGGTAGRGGAGGVTGMGGAGGSGSTCPGIPSCNWCGGQAVTNSAGCITGWRCANGADPCSMQPCPTSYTCPTGYTCNNQLCWPTGGAGGGGGSSRTGGAGGGGGAGGTSGTGGTGGMTGTGQVGVRCLNALCNTGQVCCVSQSSSTPTLTCTSQAECAGDFAVTCDGPEDCGGVGHQCCMPSGAIMQTACVTGNCLAGLAMCHSKADCAASESCCSVSTLGYAHGFCQTGTCTR